MHQIRSRTQLLKNGVIDLSVASLDTMQLNVATGRELRRPIQRQIWIEVITVVISSEVSMVTNMNDWVVDSGVTRHICGNRSAFTSYTTVKEIEEQVFMGNSRFTPMIGKGKVLFKLTSGKMLVICDVFMCQISA